MLKLTTGEGASASDVNDDMVMARGVGGAPGCADVHTTTECVTRRISERNCSGRGRPSSGSAEEEPEEGERGRTVGAAGGATRKARASGEAVWKEGWPGAAGGTRSVRGSRLAAGSGCCCCCCGGWGGGGRNVPRGRRVLLQAEHGCRGVVPGRSGRITAGAGPEP